MLELNQIKYINEGNQNLILSINKNPHYNGKVLRLSKIPLEQLETQDLKIAEIEVEIQYKFYKEILLNLIPEANLPKLDIIELNTDFLKLLNDYIEPNRPDDRKSKIINYKLTKCILMDNLIFDKGLSFEIKPKWGFLNHSQLPNNNEYCRYCKHKLCKGEEYSSYCPIDLYSKDNIAKSIDSLLESVKIDKNFKNFKFFELNEILEFNKALEKWSDLIQIEDSEKIQTSFKTLLIQIFSKTKIFELLKNLQYKLDPIGIKNIYELIVQTGLVNLNVLKDKLSDIQFTSNSINYFLNDYPAINLDLLKNDIDFCYKLTVAYIISNTFKDCSLIFNLSLFNTVSDSECIEFELCGRKYKFNLEIGVVDLDLKSVDKLKHWYELEIWICEEFQAMLDKELINIPKCKSS